MAHSSQNISRWLLLAAVNFGLALGRSGFAQPAVPATTTPAEVLVLALEGTVEVAPGGVAPRVAVQAHQVLRVGDRVFTGASSRATLRWSAQSVIRLGPLSAVTIQPPPAGKKQPSFNLWQGLLYFFHRDKTSLPIKTRTATAAIYGTEFTVALDEQNNGQTILTVVDGVMTLSNDAGGIQLVSGEQGIAAPGQIPTKTPRIVINDVIQWCLYYPAVLDVDELGLSALEEQALNESLTAYRSGDLLAALAKYPEGRAAVSAQEKVFHGALLLAVGEVGQAEALFDTLPAAPQDTLAANTAALAQAVRRMIALVKLQPRPPARPPQLATEWLVESYALQSQSHIREALGAARTAVQKSPNFGYGWERVAELEFSGGDIGPAQKALDESLRLAPRNAQAVALNGFLLAARNKISTALVAFARAIALDPGLANAWLGRGLCRIRQNKSEPGREDLLVAATVEPQRALLRSYLGKAYSNAGDTPRALTEIERAMQLDPNDPTAWLYRALLHQQNNHVNQAVSDLEQSVDLNDHRSLYRSKLSLDQDRAVRSANLAGIYRDAGLFDVSAWEASRAVAADYANFSSHLFLANSYNALRDPKQFNLRYETPAVAEYLLASLLAPVGAGTLSQSVSQQEYSKLLERDRFGVVSTTEYQSSGDWVQSGAQYGTFGNSSYALEGFYRSENGQRPNNDLTQRALALEFKQQFTPRDSLYLQVLHFEAGGGDLAQYYNQGDANPTLRFSQKQEPVVALGWHHEWNPGVHTLFLATRLKDRLAFTNAAQSTLLAVLPGAGPRTVRGLYMQQDLRVALEIYSAELQQIWQTRAHHTIAGGRIQYGHFQTQNLQSNPSDGASFFPDPPTPAAWQDETTQFKRATVYAYHSWQFADSVRGIGGVSYDHLTFPKTFRSAPISGEEETVNAISPKAGLFWTPLTNTTVRLAYTRSVAGASVDQSFQLEPSQVAGFVQSFRSLIPESVEGANAGARFETYGLSFEQKFRRGTYLGVAGELLKSKVRRSVGAFAVNPDVQDFAQPSSLREHLDFQERSLVVALHQLLGEQFSCGARYRLSEACLEKNFVGVPDTYRFVHFHPRGRQDALLHQLNLYALYHHPSGFFAQCQALWTAQSDLGDPPALPGDDFWQFNAAVGYRFPRRRAELQAGLLNITGRNYRLHPLTLYSELPRERTFVLRLQLNF